VKRACLAAAIFLLAVACATYTAKMEASRELYYEGRYEASLRGLDKLVGDASDRNRHLLLLERGKVNLALGAYDSAIVDLQTAERRFGGIEATISPGEIFKNLIVNPTMSEYQPESHEKIMLSSYLALAYWFKGDRQGAFVERNRLTGRLKQYTDGLSEGDRAALDVPFARYLAAVLYEIEGREDDARIEYEALAKLNPRAVPPVLDPRLTELIAFAEVGRAPVKVSTEIRGYLQKDGGVLAGFFHMPGSTEPQQFTMAGLGDLKLDKPGVLFTFAFPQIVKQRRIVSRCTVVMDSVEAGEMIPLDDFESTASAAYEKDLPMTLLKSAFRAYLKIAAQTQVSEKDRKTRIALGLLGKAFAVIDRADTRSWQTLPAEMRFFRIECAGGDHEAFVRYYNERNELIAQSPPVAVSANGSRKLLVYVPAVQ